MARMMKDHVGYLLQQWAREMPAIDTQGMAILGRARRIVLTAGPAIETVLRDFDLDRGEFDVLASLRRSGTPFRLSPTDLYRSLMISSGGLTARLTRLEHKGMIVRIPSTDDARSILMELTPSGRKRIEDAFRADMALEHKLVSVLTSAERRQLGTLLGKLSVAME
jgi:DNA-binding MarR family transcriptional regulator